jgi:hypothetical protein
VQFRDCLQQDTAVLVNISRINSYNKIGGVTQPNVLVEYAPMAAAINVGILQPAGDLTNLLSSGCDSGNYTFSDTDSASFSTLAMSHFCTNITSRIRIVNKTEQNTSTGYSEDFTSAYLALDYGDNKTFEWNRENGGEPTLCSWVSQPTDLMTAYFLFRSSNYEQDWRAKNCSTFPTVNTYAARINDATLEERLIDTVFLQDIFTQFKEPFVVDGDLSQTTFSWTHMMTTNHTIRDGKRESCEGSDGAASGLFKFKEHIDKPFYVHGTGYTNPSAG